MTEIKKTAWKMVFKCVVFTIMLGFAGVITSLPTYLIVLMVAAMLISPVELIYDIKNLKDGNLPTSGVGERPDPPAAPRSVAGADATLSRSDDGSDPQAV